MTSRATTAVLLMGYLLSSMAAVLSLFVLGVVLISHGPLRGIVIASVPSMLSCWSGISVRRRLRTRGFRPWMFWLASTAAGGVSFFLAPVVARGLPWVLSLVIR